MFRLLLACVAMFSLLPTAQADKIDWYVRDWPPINILQGPQQGQGAYDVMLHRLMAAMPQFEHQLHVSSLTMRQQMMQQQISHCLFGLLKTPQRQTFLQFSEVVAAIPNLQLVARADHPIWQQLQGSTAVDIDWLFQQTWRGMVEQQRTYPAPIAAHLPEMIQVAATETDLVQMLHNNRADYVLEYPDRMHYLAQQKPSVPMRTMALSGLPIVAEVYVACSISEHSKAQIKAVNQALQQLRRDPQYRSALLDWLSPASRQLIKTYMDSSPLFRQPDAAATSGSPAPIR